MPDAFGNLTEEEMRRSGYAPPQQTLLGNQQPNYSGSVGGNNVQIYGNPNAGPLGQADALANLRQNNAQGAATGAVDPTFWAAMNPGMSQADQDAYRRLNSNYNASTQVQGLGTKVGNAAQFELDRAGNLVSSVAHDPSRLFTGVDPASTGLWNGILGTDNKPLVGQLGGATEADFNRYEGQHGPGSLGAARSMSGAADYIAGMFGAAGAAHGLGQAYQGIGSQFGQGAPQGNDLGVFSNGGQGGMSQVGVGNAGVLASEGGISGGAGTGIGGSLGGAGWLSQANIKNYADLLGALNSKKDQGSGQIPFVQPILGNQQQPQQQQSSPLIGLPTNTQMPFIPTRGYRARNFHGATIWS